MSVKTLSLPEGETSGIKLTGNVKIVALQAGLSAKKQTFYKGTAATAGNELAVLGSDVKNYQIVFPEGREIPCNALYVALPNTHPCIIHYTEDN